MSALARSVPIAEIQANGNVLSARAYVGVNSTWPNPLPLLSRAEAALAASALWRAFATVQSAAPYDRHGMKRAPNPQAWRSWSAKTVHIRTNWTTRQVDKAQTNRGGWRALVHDMAHRVHGWRYPVKRPHDPLHEALEEQMARYVISHGWLDGKLKPAPKAKRSPADLVAQRRAKLDEDIARWTRKAKLAQTKLKKLRAKKRGYDRRASA
jgi:hypothetical protein